MVGPTVSGDGDSGDGFAFRTIALVEIGVDG